MPKMCNNMSNQLLFNLNMKWHQRLTKPIKCYILYYVLYKQDVFNKT